MIDHFTISVADLAASRAFYTKVLAPLGYVLSMEFEQALGFGDQHKPYLWLKWASPVTAPQHIAFKARSRAAVDAFHAAALAAGAQNDGPPGLRPHYHPNYYGAFAIDPHNGHPIEAVCHLPVGAAKPVKRQAAASKKASKKAGKTAAAKRARSTRKPSRRR